MTTKPVRIGQVYRDRGPRMSSGNRHVMVMEIAGSKAVCRLAWRGPAGGWYDHSRVPPTRIRLDRLTSSRFELVEDVTG